MNNKAINEFGFRTIRRIKQISEGVVHLSRKHPPRSLNSSYPTQPHSLIAKYLFTTVLCKPPLCKVHEDDYNLYFL